MTSSVTVRLIFVNHDGKHVEISAPVCYECSTIRWFCRATGHSKSSSDLYWRINGPRIMSIFPRLKDSDFSAVVANWKTTNPCKVRYL